MFTSPLNWVEINRKALEHNLAVFKKMTANQSVICACVKANAYGHGLIETGKIIGKDRRVWLGVNAVFEAESLRKAGIKNPIYILGYTPLSQLENAARLNCRLVVYNYETIEKLSKIAVKLHKKVPVHIKIETGNNRQGLLPSEAVKLAEKISASSLVLEGAATHFANIEDTTDHTYAFFQLKNFMDACEKIEDATGAKIPIKHCANTAATILFPETHLNMVRVGIGLYGMWPSKETYVSALREGNRGQSPAATVPFSLRPVLSWKTRISQIKEIPEGSYIGYGCTYKTTAKTRLAILPVGYYDGYDRGLSNTAYVLIKGRRAQIRGRVCMNITMVDVTDIPAAAIEDEVVLIGRQDKENISIEQMADRCNTINYEIPTRINERVPRIVI
ncbi:alanine racemase [Candidatus Peregrinibacteria bacterium]|nr:alanine racemase [Candidatus Peregrinibacteria bacterium]